MKISIIGSGYVGLVTGACLAEKGNEVISVDIDPDKIKMLKNGKVPIHEPGLSELIISNVNAKRLKFTTSLEDGVKGSDIVFLALPTPEAEDGSADLSHVLSVSSEISKILDKYTVIVTKSTVPPGTAEKVRTRLNELADHKLFDVASNPEFLKEGTAIHDFQHPDRVVIGVDSSKAWNKLYELYKPFFPNNEDRIIRTDLPTAEMIKYTSNTFLAARVALTNQIANICEATGADARKVMHAVGLDYRIGPEFLNPGPGYGGSCFPKDVQALVTAASSVGYDFTLGNTIHQANEAQKKRLLEKIQQYYGNDIRGKKFAVWGLSFKPNTDDVRETPAFHLIDGLLSAGALVSCYDPKAVENTKRRYKELEFSPMYGANRYEVVEDAHALVIVTDWDEFKSANWDKVKKSMKTSVVFDGRSLFNPDTMVGHGFYYDAIGSKVVNG